MEETSTIELNECSIDIKSKEGTHINFNCSKLILTLIEEFLIHKAHDDVMFGIVPLPPYTFTTNKCTIKTDANIIITNIDKINLIMEE
jgi:hypothetical protein